MLCMDGVRSFFSPFIEFFFNKKISTPSNKSDRLSLERLNRFFCQCVLNNYRMSYTDMLKKLKWRPVFQQVLHKQILLGRQYYSQLRYQPAGTLSLHHPNPRLIPRQHPRALTLSSSTSMNTRDSALEKLLRAWNSVPSELSRLPHGQLKIKLIELDYHSAGPDYIAMQQAILVL